MIVQQPVGRSLAVSVTAGLLPVVACAEGL